MLANIFSGPLLLFPLSLESGEFLFRKDFPEVLIGAKPVVLVTHELLEGGWQENLSIVCKGDDPTIFCLLDSCHEVVVFGFFVAGPLREGCQWLIFKFTINFCLAFQL